MPLSGREIIELKASYEALIDPFDESLIRNSSCLLTLSNRFRFWSGMDTPIAIQEENQRLQRLGPEVYLQEVTVAPNDFVLAQTHERISLPKDIMGILSTPSHIQRYGLSTIGSSVHVSRGYGNEKPSQITLELKNFNNSPLIIRPGIPIVHLFLMKISDGGPFVRSPYEGRSALCDPLLFDDWTPKK